MARGRHEVRRRFGAAAISVTVAAVLSSAFAGTAYAALRYEQARAHLVMPGVMVAGVDVSGMTRYEAVAAVTAAADRDLSIPISVSVAGRTWQVTPERLGEAADIETAVDQALAAGGDLGLWSRFWHRYRHRSLGVDVELGFDVGDDVAIKSFLDRVARKVAVAPTDAALTIGEDGDLVFIKPKDGRRLPVSQAAALVRSALVSDTPSVQLELRHVAPEITAKNLGHNIVVRVDQNRLYLYDGFKVAGSWDVATAKPGWTTPVGVWKIWDKRENPTWYNPALDSWGADLPAVIPGGPGNPMGTRAIYIDAPGLIRIHGTTDDSSIGRYASHGCIRMHNWEVEALFEKVGLGASVIVVGARPSWAQEWDTPAPSDI
jgi:lipoprotein-anchoring transpeptidase ErfK/SrfK